MREQARDLAVWLALGLAAGLFLLGVFFIAFPVPAAGLFGIEPPAGDPLSYVSALGFRDVALALYIAALALGGTRRMLGVILLISVLIPLCDTVLVAGVSGAVPQLALHAGTALALALLGAILVRR